MSIRALKKWALLLTFWVALQSRCLRADQTITGNLTVTGTTDLQGDTLTLGTRTDTSDAGSLTLYTDGTISTLEFDASRSANIWKWQQNGNTTLQMQMSLNLNNNNELVLYNQASTPVAEITLNPLGTSTFVNSLTVNGTDNEMPNQTLVNGNSVLTESLADSRYASSSSVSSLTSDITIGSGSGSGYIPGSGWESITVPNMSLNGGSATGGSSFAEGWHSTASGWGSTAMGLISTASGTYSTAMGGSTASGNYSTAMGRFSTASAYCSTAIGYSVTASGGWSSTAIGVQSIASATAATAIGFSSTASGNFSTAMGGSTASGNYSTAMGSGSTASGNYSTAMGGATASGKYATAMGNKSTSRAFDELALGQFNVGDGNSNSWVATDPVFEIGNGTPSVSYFSMFTLSEVTIPGVPSDAFVVYKNGNATLQGTLTASGGVMTTPASVAATDIPMYQGN